MNTSTTSESAPKNPGLKALLLFSVLSTLVIMALSEYRYLPEAPDKITYDMRTALFSTSAKKQRTDIAVVLITDDTLNQYWSRSPVDRGMIAELIRVIDSAEPAAIGLDFIFDRPAEPHKQEAILKAMKEAKAPIVIGYIERPEKKKRIKGMREKNFEWQDKFVRETGHRAGHIRFQNEKSRFTVDDQIIRYIGINKKQSYPSFAEVLASIKKPGAQRQSGYIAWQMKPESGGTTLFPTFVVSEHKPVDGTGNGETLLSSHVKDALKGKIVIIGADLANRDQHLTPFSVYEEEKIPGVLIHAQIVAQLLDGRGVFDLNKYLEVACVFLLGAIGFYLAFRFNLKRYDFIMGAVGITLLIVAGVLAFSSAKTILPSTTLSLAWIFGVTGGHLYRSLFKSSEPAS